MLSTVWNTQDSFTEFHREEKRRKEIEVTRRRRGGIKRGKSNLASKQFSICSLQLEPSERFMELHRAEKREEGDKGDQEKRGSQKERDRSSASTFNKTVCTKVVFPKLW